MNEEPDTKPTGRLYTWEEWQAGRAHRRALGERVAPAVIRRSESTSDRRLKAAFEGRRGPAFPRNSQEKDETSNQ